DPFSGKDAVRGVQVEVLLPLGSAWFSESSGAGEPAVVLGPLKEVLDLAFGGFAHGSQGFFPGGGSDPPPPSGGRRPRPFPRGGFGWEKIRSQSSASCGDMSSGAGFSRAEDAEGAPSPFESRGRSSASSSISANSSEVASLSPGPRTFAPMSFRSEVTTVSVPGPRHLLVTSRMCSSAVRGGREKTTSSFPAGVVPPGSPVTVAGPNPFAPS